MRNEDLTMKRKVCYYGRVSTEHESQQSAFDNQLKWYEDIIAAHENWELVGRYTDRGITGTMAKKRPNFIRMIEDASKGEFDLVVTREVCRFARNTVDTLEYTRKLKKQGVEVFFANDNIWTFESDGELRLSIMAALAQEESRKVSERVIAGQKISRNKGVLYGNGNILGYRLHRNFDADGKWISAENTYEIEPEQAETVKMIYNMYCDGMGLTKICKELERQSRKNGVGEVSWCASKISRILHNKTYAGYIGYKKSYTEDFLDHSRIKNLEKDTYEYVKGDWEPIVSEEQWNHVQILCMKKTKDIGNGKKHIMGRKETNNIWLHTLRCSCDAHSTYRRNKWRTNKKTGEMVYGYQCYSQVNKGSFKFRKENGLPTDGYCDISMIGEWKLEFMAKLLLEALWTDRREAVEEAMDMIRTCYSGENSDVDKTIALNIRSEIEKCEKRLDTLLEMRMDSEISKDKYLQLKKETEDKITESRIRLLSFQKDGDIIKSLDKKLKQMEKTMEQYIDFSEQQVSRELLEKLLVQIIPLSNNKFRWVFNLMGDEDNRFTCGVNGRKNDPIFDNTEKDLPIFLPYTGGYE